MKKRLSCFLTVLTVFALLPVKMPVQAASEVLPLPNSEVCAVSYDQKDRLLQETFSAEGAEVTVSYRYGLLYEVQEDCGDGAVTTTRFDGNGSVMWTESKRDGVSTSASVNVYDQKGKLVKRKIYLADPDQKLRLYKTLCLDYDSSRMLRRSSLPTPGPDTKGFYENLYSFYGEETAPRRIRPTDLEEALEALYPSRLMKSHTCLRRMTGEKPGQERIVGDCYEYVYDSKGVLKRETCTPVDADLKPTGKSEEEKLRFSYRDHSRLESLCTYSEDGRLLEDVGHNTYEYNREGDLINCTNASGQVLYHVLADGRHVYREGHTERIQIFTEPRRVPLDIYYDFG